jgi:hypothetical protein
MREDELQAMANSIDAVSSRWLSTEVIAVICRSRLAVLRTQAAIERSDQVIQKMAFAGTGDLVGETEEPLTSH